ncbi:hypothetical protein ABZY42_22585 [Streptomyces sp. NPDC006622]|uniref:hypothetical protein n=1 Tax=Streptomyces sp. NPDC006622 TaxID=3155459 RepID=UPI0033A9010D
MTGSGQRAPRALAVAGPAPERLTHIGALGGGTYDTDRPGPVGGPVDGERMFRSDPLADLVPPALLGDIREDAAFPRRLPGGGRAEFDAPARLRPALHRVHLCLIMLTETVPRAFAEGRARRVRESVAPEPLAALEETEKTGLS